MHLDNSLTALHFMQNQVSLWTCTAVKQQLHMQIGMDMDYVI